MLRRIVGWVVLVPLCLLLVVFALANTDPVHIYFNPFAAHQAGGVGEGDVPMFLVLFTVLLFGVVLGGVATWFAQSHHRRDERAYRRESERLHREVDALRRSPSVPASVDDFAKP